MKNSSFKTACAIAALTLASTLGLAAASDDKPQRPSREEILQKFDANGDGKLDQTERQAVRAHMQANRPDDAGRSRGPGGHPRLEQFDTDGDGKLNTAERAAAEPIIREHMSGNPRVMDRFDADGDGQLSDAEFASARDAMRDRNGGGKIPRKKKN